MDGFGSINDLLKKDDTTVGKSQPLVGYDDSTSARFQKKMQSIAVKEKEVEVQRFAQKVGIPYISLDKFPVSHEALRMVPERVAKQMQLVCFYADGEQFRLGAVDPVSDEIDAFLRDLEIRSASEGKLYVISQKSFDRVLALYKTLPTIEAISKEVKIDASELEKVQSAVEDFESFRQLLERKQTTDLVTFIMGAGLKLSASDIHIEAEEKQIALRLRIDGVLHDVAELSKENYRKLVSRLKLLSSLKINITEKPQDGRFAVKLPENTIDVRVSTIPTIYGESIVMRLLDSNREAQSLEGLGIRGQALERLQREIMRPNGMIITTGPTGSGKTTTLYAIMGILNQEDVKIITLEDPVEYKMEGINQSQIDRSKDYTFAKGLRSMLRQDPDIAMVGEIRDLETADIAIQASLTGHLMLSTVHTNDAFGAIPRFLSMGVQPFLLAPALNCVIGQRLVRRLDQEVMVPAELTEEQQQKVARLIADLPEDVKQEVLNNPIQFYTAPESEDDIGYSGRIGIYEVFTMSEKIEAAIGSGKVSEQEIRQIAKEEQTITMAQDGVLKALDGLTSLDEVFRVIE